MNININCYLAEGVGFEPTILSYACFQDRCTRPLCDPSNSKTINFLEIYSGILTQKGKIYNCYISYIGISQGNIGYID